MCLVDLGVFFPARDAMPIFAHRTLTTRAEACVQSMATKDGAIAAGLLVNEEEYTAALEKAVSEESG